MISPPHDVQIHPGHTILDTHPGLLNTVQKAACSREGAAATGRTSRFGKYNRSVRRFPAGIMFSPLKEIAIPVPRAGSKSPRAAGVSPLAAAMAMSFSIGAELLANFHFLRPACQFSSTVMVEAGSAEPLNANKNRFPSLEMSSDAAGRGSLKSMWGAPGRNCSPGSISTAMTVCRSGKM